MYVGIVDFLQDWSWKKRFERLFKIYMARKDPDGLSVMEPEAYKVRFQQNLLQIFDIHVTSGAGGGGGANTFTRDESYPPVAHRGAQIPEIDKRNNKVTEMVTTSNSKVVRPNPNLKIPSATTTTTTYNPMMSKATEIENKAPMKSIGVAEDGGEDNDDDDSNFV
jgi:hypothetical protein